MTSYLYAVCVIASLGACSSWIDHQAATSTYRVLHASVDVAKRQSDVELAREALPGGLVQLQAFAAAYPGERGFRVMYADAACSYALGFVADDWEDAKLGGRAPEAEQIAHRLTGLLASCVDANLELLPRVWRTAREQGGAAQLAAIAAVRVEDVPAVRAIASADALRLGLDPLHHLAELAGITAALTAAARLAPGADDARAELMLGTLAAARSQLLGGDDGAAQFTRARTLAGESALIVDVMFARGPAVAHKDRALFEATLGKVLAADVTRWPEHRLSNELALRKARRYLAAEAALIP